MDGDVLRCTAPECRNVGNGPERLCSVHDALFIAMSDRSKSMAVLEQVHKYLQMCIDGRSEVTNRGLARALVYEPNDED
jgi:hypothetical protein